LEEQFRYLATSSKSLRTACKSLNTSVGNYPLKCLVLPFISTTISCTN
jgi:hypothetical protein